MVIGCVVAFNEVDRVEKALRSIAPLVDRIVFVDGARVGYPLEAGASYISTDGTIEVAERYGAEVILPTGGPWQDEVTQRNQYLVGEDGDWYIVLDADEVLAGELPDLQGETDAYLLRIVATDEAPIWRGRLFRHVGWTTYRYTHYAIYRDGLLMSPHAHTDDLSILHRHDRTPEQDRRRLEAQRAGINRERAYLHNGQLPATTTRGEQMGEIAYRYTGDGAFVVGLPARDLTTLDAAKYAQVLAEHLRTAQPLYAAVAVVGEHTDAAQESNEAVLESAETPRQQRGSKRSA